MTLTQQLKEVHKEIEALRAKESLSEEQLAKVDALVDEAEVINKQIEAREKMERVEELAAKSSRKSIPKNPAGPDTQPAAKAPADFSNLQGHQWHVGEPEIMKKGFGGFDSAGSFFMAVKDRALTGRHHKIFENTAWEQQGEDGGYLVPPAISTSIDDRLRSPESLFSMVDSIPIESNSLKRVYDENQPWSGGIQASWLDEGGEAPETKARYQTKTFELNKLGALVKVSSELLADATAMGAEINKKAPEAIMHKLNEAIINGDGVGKPEGVLNSSFLVTVAKEQAQAAKTVNTKNIIKMYTRMLPMSRMNAVWLVHCELEEQLLRLKDDNDNYIALSPQWGTQMNVAPYTTLLGKRVIPMMSVLKEAGTKGDILFVDLSYYMAVQKGGIMSASSIHVDFAKDLNTFRFIFRVGGRIPYSKPVKAQNGNHTRSAFVSLADRG